MTLDPRPTGLRSPDFAQPLRHGAAARCSHLRDHGGNLSLDRMRVDARIASPDTDAAPEASRQITTGSQAITARCGVGLTEDSGRIGVHCRAKSANMAPIKTFSR